MLKRTGFKRPQVQRQRSYPSAAPAGLAARVSMARAEAPASPAPKHQYVRSPALMKAYRQIPCQVCGADDGTVCGAHSNKLEDGKGRSIKADDNKAASLCHVCHTAIDQGSHLDKPTRYRLWHSAHVKTVDELRRRGLWPENVPIPDTRRFDA